jgi:hypothetical protein
MSDCSYLPLYPTHISLSVRLPEAGPGDPRGKGAVVGATTFENEGIKGGRREQGTQGLLVFVAFPP